MKAGRTYAWRIWAVIPSVAVVLGGVSIAGGNWTQLGSTQTAFAASPIAFVQSIGIGARSNINTSGVTTFSFHPSSPTSAGDSIILVVGDDSPDITGAAVVTCSDTRNGAYTTD